MPTEQIAIPQNSSEGDDGGYLTHDSVKVYELEKKIKKLEHDLKTEKQL